MGHPVAFAPDEAQVVDGAFVAAAILELPAGREAVTSRCAERSGESFICRLSPRMMGRGRKWRDCGMKIRRCQTTSSLAIESAGGFPPGVAGCIEPASALPFTVAGGVGRTILRRAVALGVPGFVRSLEVAAVKKGRVFCWFHNAIVLWPTLKKSEFRK